MKKFLLTAFVSLLIAIPAANAESAPMSNANIFSGLLKSIGIDNPDYRLTWDEIFGVKEKNFGQNLYLQMYQKAIVEPEERVFQSIAQKYGLTLAEAAQVQSGVMAPLMRTKKARPGMAQEEAIALMNQLQGEYRETLAMEQLKNDLEAEVVPTEIFANGDISDSGFDLLTDLTEIEKILFEKTTDGTINKAYKASPLPSESSIGPIKALPSGVQEESAPSQFEPKKESSSASETGEISSSLETETPNPSENSDICFTDQKLLNAVKIFEETKNETNPSSKASSQSSEFGEVSGAIETGEGKTSPSSNASTTIPAPEKEGDYKTSTLCPDENKDGKPDTPYCVEVQLCYAQNSKGECKSNASGAAKFKNFAYVPTDDCVACHIDAIRETLRKTVDQSLIPHKVTGNIFEVPLCKASLRLPMLVNSRIIAIGTPVKTPINDDLFFGTNIYDEFMKFWTRYSPFYTPTKKLKKGARDTKEPISDRATLYEQAFNIALSQKSDETTQSEIITKVDQIVSAALREIRENVENFPIETETDNVSDQWKDLSYEMDQMNGLFRSFHDTLNEISTKTCAVIQDKRLCE